MLEAGRHVGLGSRDHDVGLVFATAQPQTSCEDLVRDVCQESVMVVGVAAAMSALGRPADQQLQHLELTIGQPGGMTV